MQSEFKHASNSGRNITQSFNNQYTVFNSVKLKKKDFFHLNYQK